MLLEFWNSRGNLLYNLVMLNYTCKLFRPYCMTNLLVSLIDSKVTASRHGL